jgi:hypothetical protein
MRTLLKALQEPHDMYFLNAGREAGCAGDNLGGVALLDPIIK